MLRLRPRLSLLALTALVVAWLAATAVLFVWPHEDSPAHADAVVVLSGSRTSRLDKALTLMRRGVAPVLVISDGRDPLWPQANRLCAGGGRFAVLCFRPSPYSTRGEAEAVASMAARRGWRSIVIVTSTYHVSRARLLFERCFHGRVQAVGSRYTLTRLPYEVVAEWAKLALAETFRRGC